MAAATSGWRLLGASSTKALGCTCADTTARASTTRSAPLATPNVGATICDVSRVEDVKRPVPDAEQSLGGIDVLANNAGISWREPFLEVTAENWDRILEVNVRGMFLAGQAVARHMVARGGGTIVNMASTNGLGAEADFTHCNHRRVPSSS